MSGFVDFFKDIFMIGPEASFIGLSGIKQERAKNKKHIVKSVKKSEPKLSDLMKKDRNIKREETLNY